MHKIKLCDGQPRSQVSQELCGVGQMQCNATRTQEGPLKLTDKRSSLKRKENWRKLLLHIQSGDKLAKPQFFFAYSWLSRHCRNLAEGGGLSSQFHLTFCHYFLGHVVCQNLPWQGLKYGSWKRGSVVHRESRVLWKLRPSKTKT